MFKPPTTIDHVTFINYNTSGLLALIYVYIDSTIDLNTCRLSVYLYLIQIAYLTNIAVQSLMTICVCYEVHIKI